MRSTNGQIVEDRVAPSATAERDLLYSRIAWRIIPLFLASYIIAYLDRVNVGFAKLQMIGDLKFSDEIYGLGAGMFFIGYFAFEIPSNLILHRVGARAWLCRIMITWAIMSACMALVRTPWQFYTCRFLLGLAEGGFFPGMVLYLTYWFPSQRRARLMALLMAGNPISGIIGGPLSGFILRSFSHSAGMAGWQWLFVLEALPAFLAGLLMYAFLDDRVAHAKWLTVEEKNIIQLDVSTEAKSKQHRTVLAALTSPRVWLMCAILFTIAMGSYAIGFWQPTIIRSTGVRDYFHLGLLTMLPYATALIAMVLVGRHADKTRERRWHLILPNLAAATGFLLCTITAGNTALATASLVLSVTGVVTALPMFWALPTSILTDRAAAAGLALVNCTGNLSGFVSPTVIGFLKTSTGTLTSGLYMVAACHVLAGLLILLFIPARLVNR